MTQAFLPGHDSGWNQNVGAACSPCCDMVVSGSGEGEQDNVDDNNDNKSRA